VTEILSPAQRQEVQDLRSRVGRVAVLMGGDSAEREVSLRSGAAVLNALRHLEFDVTGIDWQRDQLPTLLASRPDYVFIALHGRGGEDGALQGALDIAGIPYSGSGVLGCALSMDKIRSKRIWQSTNLSTPDFVLATDPLPVVEIIARLGLPVMVKPAREGSSIGISLVERREELAAAVALARTFDHDVLIESFVSGGEYTLAIVDDVALPLIKLETPRKFYDYEAKYLTDTTRYVCPVDLPERAERLLIEQGKAAFQALDAQGWARIDFMLDPLGQPWLIELNAVPGMTDHSLVPMAAREAGWSFEYLVSRILGAKLRLNP
jgi:D-alanine-D-alanine ligase